MVFMLLAQLTRTIVWYQERKCFRSWLSGHREMLFEADEKNIYSVLLYDPEPIEYYILNIELQMFQELRNTEGTWMNITRSYWNLEIITLPYVSHFEAFRIWSGWGTAGLVRLAVQSHVWMWSSNWDNTWKVENEIVLSLTGLFPNNETPWGARQNPIPTYWMELNRNKSSFLEEEEGNWECKQKIVIVSSLAIYSTKFEWYSSK